MAKRSGHSVGWVVATGVLGTGMVLGWWWRSRHPCAHFINRAAGIPKRYQDIGILVFRLNGSHVAYAYDANGEQVASAIQPSSTAAVRSIMPTVLGLQRFAVEGDGG